MVEARPKIMTTVNGEEWIIKFPAHVDGENAGKMEYDYSCCAKKCGIIMSETRLFPSENCEGYFGLSGLTGYQIKMEQREFIC